MVGVSLHSQTCYALYASISNVGGPFYGYGGSRSARDRRCVPCRRIPNGEEYWPRWLAFNSCWGGPHQLRARGRTSDGWHDLTAMTTFFETQPLPSPMSRRLHFAPRQFHLFATASNHVIELFAPLGLLIGCVLRILPFSGLRSVGRSLVVFYGLVHVLFQVALIGSGNLSFLNYLTIIPALACFDDAALMWLWGLPRRQHGPGIRWVLNLPWRWAGFLYSLVEQARLREFGGPARKDSTSKRQVMNGSFDRVACPASAEATDSAHPGR